MEKRADILVSAVIFIVIVVAFFGIMFFVVGRVSSQSSLVEQIYAKQVSLLIDKAKPGTEVYIDISRLEEIAKKNSFREEIIKIDNKKKEVVVRLTKGEGYSSNFFSNNDVLWNIEGDRLYLGVLE
jgi:hypothetical protein